MVACYYSYISRGLVLSGICSPRHNVSPEATPAPAAVPLTVRPVASTSSTVHRNDLAIMTAAPSGMWLWPCEVMYNSVDGGGSSV